MKISRNILLTCLIALVGITIPARSFAQSTNRQELASAFATDASQLSTKFAGLAGAMSGKYDWRPGQGVRSVSDVFNLIVMENGMLTGVVTGAQSASGPRPAPITDPAAMQDAIKNSYAALEKALSSLSESDLKTTVKMFGRDMTKESAIMALLADQHEHLGQSIAYARVNNVVPPWSK